MYDWIILSILFNSSKLLHRQLGSINSHGIAASGIAARINNTSICFYYKVDKPIKFDGSSVITTLFLREFIDITYFGSSISSVSYGDGCCTSGSRRISDKSSGDDRSRCNKEVFDIAAARCRLSNRLTVVGFLFLRFMHRWFLCFWEIQSKKILGWNRCRKFTKIRTSGHEGRNRLPVDVNCTRVSRLCMVCTISWSFTVRTPRWVAVFAQRSPLKMRHRKIIFVRQQNGRQISFEDLLPSKRWITLSPWILLQWPPCQYFWHHYQVSQFFWHDPKIEECKNKVARKMASAICAFHIFPIWCEISLA